MAAATSAVLDAYGWHDQPSDEQLPELLATLATLGRARQLEDGRWLG